MTPFCSSFLFSQRTKLNVQSQIAIHNLNCSKKTLQEIFALESEFGALKAINTKKSHFWAAANYRKYCLENGLSKFDCTVFEKIKRFEKKLKRSLN